jgi:hypothetical protein
MLFLNYRIFYSRIVQNSLIKSGLL